MAKINFPNNTFNIIVAFFSIIHVPRKFHKKIISDIYRMLKPNGTILITMGLNEDKQFINTKWHGVKMYWSTFSKETNLKLIKEAGFKILWNKNIGPKKDRHLYIMARKQ